VSLELGTMMSTTVDLQSLEQLCETLYNPPNSESRIHAESVLNFHFPAFSSLGGASGSDQDGSNGGLDGKLSHNPSISSPIGSALLCRDLLESSKNPYALMYVALVGCVRSTDSCRSAFVDNIHSKSRK